MSLQALIPIVLNASLFLLVVTIGLKASVHDVTYLFRRPGELVRMLLAMNVLMPLFAVALVLMFDLHPVVKIALVALSVSPIPPLRPIRLTGAGATESYAVGILIAGSVLAIVFVPLAMKILELVFHLPLHMTMASIAGVVFVWVLLPIGLGVAVRSLAPRPAELLAKPFFLIGAVGGLACVVAVLFAAAPGIWSLIGNGTIIALAAFVIVGMAVGHFLGGPNPEDRTALALSTASRHPGIAIAIAQTNFPQQKLAMAAVLLYTLVDLIGSLVYRKLTKPRRSENADEGMTNAAIS